jgi:hypothetical protein
MHPFRFVVSLRFSSDLVTPAEIGKVLNRPPKWQREKGKLRFPKDDLLGDLYDANYCAFQIPRHGEEELSELLERLVIELAPHKRLFHRIHETSGRTECFVDWYAPVSSGTIFDSAVLEKLGILKIDLALDVHADR